MTIAELRKIFDALPDETEVCVDYGDGMVELEGTLPVVEVTVRYLAYDTVTVAVS